MLSALVRWIALGNYALMHCPCIEMIALLGSFTGSGRISRWLSQEYQPKQATQKACFAPATHGPYSSLAAHVFGSENQAPVVQSNPSWDAHDPLPSPQVARLLVNP